MDKVRKHLDKVDLLPPSPALLAKLLPKLSDVDTNFDEVVEIIAYDPALTSKLLQICNSAFFGQQSEVNSVAEAVNRVGYQSVYLLVAMINGSASFAYPMPVGANSLKIWQHSITTAFNAKFVAESAGVDDGNISFTAGLLHDLGKVILVQEDPAIAAKFRFASDAAGLEHERTVFGCTHAELGAALLERWKLPTQIIVGVRHHHQPREAQGLSNVAASISLGNLLTHSQEHPKLLESPEFVDALKVLDLSKEHLKRWGERLRDNQGLMTSMCRLPI